MYKTCYMALPVAVTLLNKVIMLMVSDRGVGNGIFPTLTIRANAIPGAPAMFYFQLEVYSMCDWPSSRATKAIIVTK